jgi:hypothetical protein
MKPVTPRAPVGQDASPAGVVLPKTGDYKGITGACQGFKPMFSVVGRLCRVEAGSDEHQGARYGSKKEVLIFPYNQAF